MQRERRREESTTEHIRFAVPNVGTENRKVRRPHERSGCWGSDDIHPVIKSAKFDADFD